MTDTQTPTLEALLRRWAELEPDHCMVRESGEYGSAPVVHLDGIGWDHMPLDDYDDLRMCTQFAVQQAIEARGMWWALDNDVVDKKYAAVVNERRWGNLDWYGFSDDTPAAALLSAYLQALEAQQ